MSHDQTLQEAFKRDGFVHLPAAETPDLVELRASAKPDPEAHRRYRESVQVQQEDMGVR